MLKPEKNLAKGSFKNLTIVRSNGYKTYIVNGAS